ncbi:hypothetical protein RLDS_13335 [Sphingobium lactosutens DS20]|uniref:Uncharacterized protein n=1 Tax=Sphingobium lactosutens DS20 TaxID=1331060 RepID=T0HQG2_9SPHN|nr:hypothetical protein RLDS_13335 [Sphingobium lactosutens DS20]
MVLSASLQKNMALRTRLELILGFIEPQIRVADSQFTLTMLK